MNVTATVQAVLSCLEDVALLVVEVLDELDVEPEVEPEGGVSTIGAGVGEEDTVDERVDTPAREEEEDDPSRDPTSAAKAELCVLSRLLTEASTPDEVPLTLLLVPLLDNDEEPAGETAAGDASSKLLLLVVESDEPAAPPAAGEGEASASASDEEEAKEPAAGDGVASTELAPPAAAGETGVAATGVAPGSTATRLLGEDWATTMSRWPRKKIVGTSIDRQVSSFMVSSE